MFAFVCEVRVAGSDGDVDRGGGGGLKYDIAGAGTEAVGGGVGQARFAVCIGGAVEPAGGGEPIIAKAVVW